MPLALMGFTLQSVPPDGSTALSSSLVTTHTAYPVSIYNRRLVQTNSQALLIRKQVRPNKYAEYVVLICPRVRSHPALVLPAADGRYSRGVCAFQGMSPVNPG